MQTAYMDLDWKVVFFDPVSIMERERSSLKDGAMKLKLYVLSTAFD